MRKNVSKTGWGRLKKLDFPEKNSKKLVKFNTTASNM